MKERSINLKWLACGIICGVLSPPAGIVVGYCLYTEPDLKTEGKITLVISVISFAITISVFRIFMG